MATCRECKLFALDDVKSKSGAVLSSRVGRCLWQSKERWPISVRHSPRPHVGKMLPTEGFGCPNFQKAAHDPTTINRVGVCRGREVVSERMELIDAIVDDLLLMRNAPSLVDDLKRAALKVRPGDVCLDTVRNIQVTVEDTISENLMVGVRAVFGQYGCDPRKLIPMPTPPEGKQEQTNDRT